MLDFQVRTTQENRRVLLLSVPGTAVPEVLINASADLMAADPRVATVSLLRRVVGEVKPTPQYANATSPVGDVVVVNLAVEDLVRLPEDMGSVEAWIEWAREANNRGFRHLWLAVESKVRHDGATAGFPMSEIDSQELEDDSSALASLMRESGPSRRLTIAVDAAWLGPYETGAQVFLVQLLCALARRDDVSELRLYDVQGGVLPHYAQRLKEINKVVLGDRRARVRSDVFWRPYQPDLASYTDSDRELGRRVVATVQDLIAYSNIRYHPNNQVMAELRRHLRSHLEQLDGIAAISQDVADHLLMEVPGLSAERITVTPNGAEHLADQLGLTGDRPAELDSMGAEEIPFLLVLGNDFMHKNRDFAVRVWREVVKTHKVNLVLAGLHVHQWSAEEYERETRDVVPENGAVLRLFGSVSSESRSWLLANAAIVLYPTAAEGFGLVPFEAASLGTPTVLTRFGPLAENLPPTVGVASWSLHAYADEVRRLLDSDEERDSLVAEVNGAAARLTWENSAAQLLVAFRNAVSVPPRPHVSVPWSQDCPICEP